MRYAPRMRRKLAVPLGLAALALLAGCTTGIATPTATSTPTSSPAPQKPTPTATPSPVAAPVIGTCGPTDGVTPGLATVYSAFVTDTTTPVTMTYSVFNKDGTIDKRTETVTGPVVTRVSYPCTDAAQSAIWTFTVVGPAGRTEVGCSMAFGVAVTKSDSPADSDRRTVDCSGNPGM
jgi:hypothetical protein